MQLNTGTYKSFMHINANSLDKKISNSKQAKYIKLVTIATHLSTLNQGDLWLRTKNSKKMCLHTIHVIKCVNKNIYT